MTSSSADPTTTAALPHAQRKFDAATVAHHRRYCLTCAQGEKPCVGPSVQECRDVEVILNAYDAG